MKVAIVGSGISGVTTALRLQQLGVQTTLWAERSPAEQRTAPLENLVARFPATQEREHELGVSHWDHVDDYASWGIDLDVVGTGIGFRGHLEQPARAVDFRVYLSRLAEDYQARGGALRLDTLPTTIDELTERTAHHDVLVVAAGRSAPVAAALFAVRHDRSPYSAPQRRLCGGLYAGVTQSEPVAVSYNIVLGAGEIFQQAILAERGVVSSILVEAVPDGPLDAITRFDHAGDLCGFSAALLDLIETHAPALRARIDQDRFTALGPLDVVRGAVTPTVRRAWSELPDGRLALATGDAWIANDPITGQGANIGSHSAWVVADALAAGPELDEALGRRLDEELWAFAGPVTSWTNGFLQPPPPHVMTLLGAATNHQAVADAFVGGFAEPDRLAAALSTPETCDAFMREALLAVPA